jgi:hypothetical protein
MKFSPLPCYLVPTKGKASLLCFSIFIKQCNKI